MAVLPPIDAHAHVDTDVDSRSLRGLRSVIFAVTNNPADWPAALDRHDELCVWGVGCHPTEPQAIAAFDQQALALAVEGTPLIGEVGLDGRSTVPMADQRAVLRAALEVATQQSRIVSIHNVGTAGMVLDEIEAAGGVPGAILHWWRGSPAETARAIELGCFFSLNGHEARSPKVITELPPERVLSETDYPHSKRYDKTAVRPGAVRTIESAFADAWSLTPDDVRRQLWKNLATLCAITETSSLMPRRLQASLLVVH